jgi:hypothetical protein
MHRWLLALFALAASAQEVLPAWELKPQLEALNAQLQRYEPVLRKLELQGWVDRGAPEVWKEQHANALREALYLQQSSALLAKSPEKLAAALDTYLRMETLQSLVSSLAGAAEQYQSSATAETLRALSHETDPHRDKLRQYLLELAANRDATLGVLETEARRCRGMTMPERKPRPRR